MQHRAQRLISTAPIGIECLCDLLEPHVRLMKCFIEYLEAGKTHDSTFRNWTKRAGRRTAGPLLSIILRAAARGCLDSHQFTECRSPHTHPDFDVEMWKLRVTHQPAASH